MAFKFGLMNLLCDKLILSAFNGVSVFSQHRRKGQESLK